MYAYYLRGSGRNRHDEDKSRKRITYVSIPDMLFPQLLRQGTQSEKHKYNITDGNAYRKKRTHKCAGPGNRYYHSHQAPGPPGLTFPAFQKKIPEK